MTAAAGRYAASRAPARWWRSCQPYTQAATATARLSSSLRRRGPDVAGASRCRCLEVSLPGG